MKKFSQFKILTLLSGAFILVGCAPMNSNFDCTKVGGEGAGCVSLDQVNTMANEGKFNQNSTLASSDQSGKDGSTKDINGVINYTNNGQGYPVATPTAGSPIWHDADKQRIWLAPWVDTDGNFHDSAYIYFKLDNGYWIGHPDSAINATE